VKGTPFRLGTICSCSGVQAASLGAVSSGSTIWLKSVNAAGGINGHPVSLTVLDDGGSPVTALQDVKRLIQSDHIQALVGDMSLADQSFEPYIAQAGIPVLGGLPVSTAFLTSPDFFNIGANLPVDTVGLGALAKGAGKKTFGVVYCTESPICAQANVIGKAAAALSGLGFASLGVSSNAPSYTAPCLALKSKGVDSVFPAVNGAVVPRVMAACAQQGYKPTVLANASSVLPSWLTDPNLQGTLIASSSPLVQDASNPAITVFRAAVQKFDPSLLTSQQFNVDVLAAWAAGKLFEAAAAAGRLTPSSTPAQVKAAVYKANGTTLGGLTAPLPIIPGQPVITPCYYGAKIANDTLSPTGGGKPYCLTKTQTTALLTGLKKLLG
jgi:branched-chain amino acid transport system substrate-binding protein